MTYANTSYTRGSAASLPTSGVRAGYHRILRALQRPAWVLGLALAPLAFLGVYAVLGFPNQGIDDADITLVYARNLAAGHGYVYTPGHEVVEGSTSALWTLICAAVIATVGTWTGWLFAAGILLTAAAVAGAFLLLRGENVHRERLLAALFLCASPAFFGWSEGTLMDSALWTAAITLGVVCAIAPRESLPRWALYASLCAVPLARPEGFLVGPALAALHAACERLRGKSVRDSALAAAGPLASVLLVIAVSTAVRYAYFGYPLPNTYYAKVGDDRVLTAFRGLKYAGYFVLTTPVAFVAFGCAVVVVLRHGRNALSRLRFGFHGVALSERAITELALVAVLALAVVIRVLSGADHFIGYRQMQPFVPVCCALGALVVGPLLARALPVRRQTALVVMAAVAAFTWVRFARYEGPGIQGEIGLGVFQRQMAAGLEEHFAPIDKLPAVAVIAAGGFAYEYGGRVLDLLGLNWVAMAHGTRDRSGHPGHASFHAPTFWASAPPVVLPEPLLRPADSQDLDACTLYANISWFDDILHGLLSSQRFRETYTGMVLPAPRGAYGLFVDRDWAEAHPVAGARLVDWPADAAQRADCQLP